MANLTTDILNILLYYEGASVVAQNVPGDAGGWTKYGIAQASHPDVDVRNLTLDQAVAIYQTQYWNAFHCNLINSPLVGTQLFLGVVNTNQKAVQMALQTAYNGLGNGSPIAVDGNVGPGTAGVINALSNDQTNHLTTLMSVAMDNHYQKLVAAIPADAKFLKGWLRRAHWPYLSMGAWPYIDPNWSPVI